MIPDLTLALIAAAVVCVAPGWFWASALRPTPDLAERLAYSVALSLLLVPAVALVPASLFGLGVTLAVAASSVALVFFSGLGAYVWLGRGKVSKEPDVPLSRPPGPLGLPALVALGVAAVLALAFLGGLLPVEGAPLVALVVLAAGAAALIGPRATEDAENEDAVDEPARPSALASVARYGLLGLVLGLVLYRGYSGPLAHDWPYLRGVDQYEHAVMADMMISSGSTESFMLYPPGFHVVLASLRHFTGLDALDVFPLLAPALLVLPPLACYALARLVWGWQAGVAAALVSGLVASSTYMHFAEARYPNLLTVHFLLTMLVAALFLVFRSPGVRTALLFAGLGGAVVMHHQVASFYAAALLAAVGALFVPYLLLRRRHRRLGLALFGAYAGLGALAVVFAWDTYDLPDLIGGSGRGGDAVSMALGTQPPLSFEHLLAVSSGAALWLGLFGGLLLLIEGRASDGPHPLAYALARATILLWAATMFVGSRTAASGFPERFERDLGIPLSILAAVALVAVLRSIPRPFGNPAPGGLARAAGALAALVVVLPVAVLVGAQAVDNLRWAGGPVARMPNILETRSSQVMLTPELEEAGAWLEANNTGGNILPSPYYDLLPARGMLAMGGYTRLQAYDPGRIELARDLPPFGAGPLREVIHVLGNPAGERTGRILEENDVRYLVLYKHPPGDGYWDPADFAARDDLYRGVFENREVLVLEPTGR